jgi:FdhE protein
VAGDFLRKLLGRKPALPPEVEAARADLKALAEQRPAIAELAEQLADCLLVLYAEPVRVAVPTLTAEMAAEKQSRGVPLLRGEALDVDWAAVTRRLLDLADALGQRRPDAAPAVGAAVRSQNLDVAELTSAILTGQPHAVHERADALGLDAALTGSVLSLALFPVLVPISAGLASLVSTGWQEGHCPVCGSYPKLGEFRGLEQTRLLRCGLCAAEWAFPRLRCAGCGSRDHRQLGYLSVDGEEGKWRAATCEACRQYVKMVSTLTPLPPLQVLVRDVATVHLDLLAAQEGFAPLL